MLNLRGFLLRNCINVPVMDGISVSFFYKLKKKSHLCNLPSSRWILPAVRTSGVQARWTSELGRRETSTSLCWRWAESSPRWWRNGLTSRTGRDTKPRKCTCRKTWQFYEKPEMCYEEVLSCQELDEKVLCFYVSAKYKATHNLFLHRDL